MTTKKKTEDDLVVENVTEVEKTEEAPKPKRTRKTAAKAEEPKTEEKKPVTKKAKEDKTPVLGIKTPEENQKPVMAKTKAKSASENTVPYKAIVTSSIINVKKGPGMGFACIRNLTSGTRINVLEVYGNWGKIGVDQWVNINYIKKV